MSYIREQCEGLGFSPAMRTVPSLHYVTAVANNQGVALALASHPLMSAMDGVVVRRFAPGDRMSQPICLILNHNRREASPARILARWLSKEWSLD